MGIPVLIMGPSGSGKTTSLRSFEENEIGILNVASKPLPFRKKLKKVNKADYGTIAKVISKGGFKSYAIDDSQYLMAFESFRRAQEAGFNKSIELAKNFKELITFVIERAPSDVIVYFLHHTETTDDGRVKAKTLGKMLDNQLTVEGLFSIVLYAVRNDNGYKFITQSDGLTTAKSPMEMFDLEIDNDLKFVDKTIREYWEL